MSIDRANLVGSGAPKVTFNGATFWTRDDVAAQLSHELSEQRSSMYGRVTKTKGGRKVELELPLFGLWDGLTTLFPAAVVNPVVGGRVFGAADVPLVLHAKNGDRLTIHNAAITGLANLKLATNQQIFSGAAKFTGLIKNNAAPADAGAYYTFDTAAYVEGDFAMTKFMSRAWTGAWGTRTGFTSIATQAGWEIAWEMAAEEDVVDGLGPVDLFLQTFWAKASCIPVGPTPAQLETGLSYQGAATADIGAGLHESVDDLVLTSGTASVTLKAAAMVETGLVFAPSKKRVGNTVWESTRGFTAGAPNAIAAVA